MNGDTAGLEPADRGGEVDAQPRKWEALDILREAEALLETIGEYKAAREVHDAAIRLRSDVEVFLEAVREGERSRKAVHGQDPQDAEVEPWTTRTHG